MLESYSEILLLFSDYNPSTFLLADGGDLDSSLTYFPTFSIAYNPFCAIISKWI